MNPSSSGWIQKYFKLTEKSSYFLQDDYSAFYEKLRASGFIYGTSVYSVIDTIDDSGLTQEEITKINLLSALAGSYFHLAPGGSVDDFIQRAITFYEIVKTDTFSIIPDLFGGKMNAAQLEKIIAKRALFDSNVLTKNFSSVLTNTLLFIDVLTFQKYISEPDTDCLQCIKNIETVIEDVVITTIKSKKNKSKYDKQLLKLFESSLRYHEYYDAPKLNIGEHLSLLTKPLEKQYLLDITCMTVWDDKKLEIAEVAFINKLGKELGIPKSIVNFSILKVYDFFESHKEKLTYLNDPNPVKNFYDNSSRMVTNLIIRNSKRLLLEISQSKDLVVLLSQSTLRDLNKEEKQKVKEQLLDICKTIPSLAIFLLPGGSVLLPLLIKFIPKLLPSAFDDNRLD